MAEFVKLLQRIEVESSSTPSSSSQANAARSPSVVATEASDLFRLMETRGDGYLRWSDFSSFVINLDTSGSGGGGPDPDALVPGAGSSSRRTNSKKKHHGGKSGGAGKSSGGASSSPPLMAGTHGLPPPVYGRVATTVGAGACLQFWGALVLPRLFCSLRCTTSRLSS